MEKSHPRLLNHRLRIVMSSNVIALRSFAGGWGTHPHGVYPHIRAHRLALVAVRNSPLMEAADGE
jgi:hypothetical protein